jgi:hypothetical protein
MNPIILFYLFPGQGLVHSLYFRHLNPKIKRGLNQIKMSLLNLSVNPAKGHETITLKFAKKELYSSMM